MEESFLSTIAQEYYTNYKDQITTTGFVFPNRRAGLFFRKALAQHAGEPIFAPDILGINDILYHYSGLQKADQITLLFELYKQYSSISQNNEAFDNFISFGQMLLNDFNEIDKYLIDASQLFQNIADINEIEHQFDFIGPEQKEIIAHFWGYFIPDTDKPINKKYIELWRNLYAIYKSFNEALRAKQIGYDGMLFKESAIKMQNNEPLDIKYKKMVFIGFNALTPTEKAVFDYFKRLNIADYYFDYESQWIQALPESAGLFVKDNLRNYHSQIKLTPPKDNTPEIQVISVPSLIGQTKQIESILKQISDNKGWEESQTAVILPEESLLLPMLHAIPQNVKSINITMGYPLSQTPMATLVKHIAQLQKELRLENDTLHFYYKPVLAILSHPYIYNTDKELIGQLIEILTQKNSITITPEKLKVTPLLTHIFIPQQEPSSAILYVKQIIKDIHHYLLSENTNPLDNEFFYCYESAYNRLSDNIAEYQIDIQLNTFFNLIEKFTATISVPFKGEPLIGLQVMGMLETRSLDFDHIIIASFNDDVIPRQEHIQSIIPYNLKKAFGLPTYENNDAIYAYNFYRLLTRSKKITLLYDSRSDSNKGEISRFYNQLKYLFKLDLPLQTISYAIERTEANVILIEKTGEVRQLLEKFLLNDKYSTLSASSLNEYINCPLQFYFSKIENLNSKNEIDESIQANIFGSIFHYVMEQIYKSYKNTEITASVLEAIEKNTTQIDLYIKEGFNKIYFKKEHSEPLKGFNLLVAKIISKYVKNTIRFDKQRVPFIYIDSEEKMSSIQFTISSNKVIKFKGFIDRLDRSDAVTNIIDYKTGKIHSNYKSEEDLFTPNKQRPKEIMQALLYCMLYEIKNPGTITKPSLYNIREINYLKDADIKRGTQIIENYAMIKDSFESHLSRCLEDLFNYDIPFTQTNIPEICLNCSFKKICNR